MPHPSDDDQPLNFGSEFNIKACLKNCVQGECCECDEIPETSSSEGQQALSPYQQSTARQSLQSVASSGQGPSQPRPIAAEQQYQPTQPMNYGSASHAGHGEAASSGAHGASYGGVSTARQVPSGFTTQASSCPEGAGVTPLQASMGCYRDTENRLCNSRGEHINERFEVIRAPGPSSLPLSSSMTSGFSGGDESFQTAPSHNSGSRGGGGSQAASTHSGSRDGKKNQ